MRNFNSGHERQKQNFYATPAWVTEALLRSVRLPKGIVRAADLSSQYSRFVPL
jgi:hypothetical protein